MPTGEEPRSRLGQGSEGEPMPTWKRQASTIYPWKPGFAHKQLTLDLCKTDFQTLAVTLHEKEEEFAT